MIAHNCNKNLTGIIGVHKIKKNNKKKNQKKSKKKSKRSTKMKQIICTL